MKQQLNPHALDHLSHLWQFFRKSADRTQPTDAIRVATGGNPQTLEQFFLANAKSIDSEGRE